jgi:protein O-mannosyl-transferase
MKVAQSAAGPDRWDLWICLLLLNAVAVVYGQVRHFGFINYDDPDYVDNAHVRHGLTPENLIRAFTSGDAANWIPLTRTFHLLDRQLFGLKSGLHHLMSVLIHAFSSLLLFWLLKRMTGAR